MQAVIVEPHPPIRRPCACAGPFVTEKKILALRTQRTQDAEDRTAFSRSFSSLCGLRVLFLSDELSRTHAYAVMTTEIVTATDPPLACSRSELACRSASLRLRSACRTRP